MARNTGRRQQNRPASDWNHFYVYGSAVRQPEALPSGNETVRKPKKKRTSRQVIRTGIVRSGSVRHMRLF